MFNVSSKRVVFIDFQPPPFTSSVFLVSPLCYIGKIHPLYLQVSAGLDILCRRFELCCHSKTPLPLNRTLGAANVRGDFLRLQPGLEIGFDFVPIPLRQLFPFPCFCSTMILFHFAVSLSVSFCVVTKSLTEPFAKWNFLRQFILQLT